MICLSQKSFPFSLLHIPTHSYSFPQRGKAREKGWAKKLAHKELKQRAVKKT